MRNRLVLATVILLAVVAELLSMTITDPKIYTKPWTGQLKRFRLLPQNGVQTIDGWAGLVEDLCAPADEVKNSIDWFATPPGAWSSAGYWPSTENTSSKFPGITGSRE